MFRPLPPTILLSVLVLAFASSVGAQTSCFIDRECADADFCNGIERCISGTCATGEPLVCDDGDPCTIDSCVATAGCAHADTACSATCGPGDDGLRCSDGTACTTGDTCSGSVCVGTPLACDDGDVCTADSCDAELGCVYVEQADPPACVTSSQCVLTADHTPCVGDGDPCTQDGCLEGACRVGLIQAVRQCADLDACNGDEFCSPVKGCEPNNPLHCDDGALCNGTETCASATGCVAGTAAADGTACDDGQTCTDGDVCGAGTCSGTTLDCNDGNGTTTDLCLEPAGCLHCAPLTAGKLALRFVSATRPGRFTTAGRFVAITPFSPTAPAGVDLFVHDGATVVQHSHVAGSAFTSTGGGSVTRFVDRSGTVAQGLERMRLKLGPVGTRHQLGASGTLADESVTSRPTRSLTLQAGSSCATVTLTCRASAGGKSDRCK